MNPYSLTHLSDAAVLQGGRSSHSDERSATAISLAHLSEIDARKLYVAEGYSSMFLYCLGELHLSEDCASRRLQAARVARRFPVLFAAIADGRLHLTGTALLAPHFTLENFDEVLLACTHRSRGQIQEWLAIRFPETAAPAVRASIRPVVSAPVHVKSATDVASRGQLLAALDAPGAPLTDDGNANSATHTDRSAQGREHLSIPTRRFQITVSVSESTHEKLRYLQTLMSHSLASGDVAGLVDKAFDALIEKVEKRKLGSTRVASARGARPASRTSNGSSRSRASGPRSASRYVPVRIRRTVWERDQGRCTFVSTSGHRCGERRFLEFDHTQPVARGGTSTVEGLRLRCRTHNQYEAERALGRDFMRDKREEARQIRPRQPRGIEVRAGDRHAVDDATHDIEAGLRSLGCRQTKPGPSSTSSATRSGWTGAEPCRSASG